MSETVRVGLIGCGAIARRHIEWFLERPECEVVALCDVSRPAAEEKRAMVNAIRPGAGIALFTNYGRLLECADLDGVAVLLPHALHHEVTLAAIQAGKHVLVEKPMAVSSRQAREMIDAARRGARVLALGYQRSYLPEYAYVRRMVAAGELGKLQFVTAHLEQSWCRHVKERVAARGWKTDPIAAGGGQLVDTGSHTLAALLDVTRLTPAEVYAVINHCDLPVDVNSSLVVRFAEGAQASISIGGFGHSVTESIRVVGEEHSARIFFRTVREQALEIDGAPVDAPSAIPRSTPNANFVDAVLGKTDVTADGTLGLRVAQLTEAAYASACSDRPVKIKS